MRGRVAGAIQEEVQLIEIALGEIACAPRVGVLEGDRDYPALLVVNDRREAGKMFRGIDAITIVINPLQVKAVDEMVGDRSAAEQIGKQRGRVIAAEQAAGESAESAHSAERAARQGGD